MELQKRFGKEDLEMNNHQRVCAKIDLSAIKYNCKQLYEKNDKTPVYAVIKTDGYGHGAVEIAICLEREDYICGFAVATANEALELRKNGIKKEILILGYTFEEDYTQLISQDISLCVFTKAMAEQINRCASSLEKKALIHIKIDTGMHRIGFLPEEESVKDILEIAALDFLSLKGMFTHFAKADETNKDAAILQFDKFMWMREKLQQKGVCFELYHCNNSAASIDLTNYHLDRIRGGIAIYGILPSNEVSLDYKLQPALSLTSHIVHLKWLEKGNEISYGGTYTTSKRQRIATIPVGYGDGYPRSLSNKGYVLIRGEKAPIVGRICMDQFMVDVTNIPEVNVLDPVILIGTSENERITVEELGELSHRFPYELVCDLNKRIPREYIGKE